MQASCTPPDDCGCDDCGECDPQCTVTYTCTITLSVSNGTLQVAYTDNFNYQGDCNCSCYPCPDEV